MLSAFVHVLVLLLPPGLDDVSPAAILVVDFEFESPLLLEILPILFTASNFSRESPKVFSRSLHLYSASATRTRRNNLLSFLNHFSFLNNNIVIIISYCQSVVKNFICL